MDYGNRAVSLDGKEKFQRLLLLLTAFLLKVELVVVGNK